MMAPPDSRILLSTFARSSNGTLALCQLTATAAYPGNRPIARQGTTHSEARHRTPRTPRRVAAPSSRAPGLHTSQRVEVALVGVGEGVEVLLGALLR